MDIVIYHNPRCQKSRESLELLQEHDKHIEIVEYLKTPPTAAALKALLQKLNLPAEAIVRKSEAIYKTQYAGKKLTETAWIKAMVTYPILIERPIVVKGNKAVIGRPPENVLKLL